MQKKLDFSLQFYYCLMINERRDSIGMTSMSFVQYIELLRRRSTALNEKGILELSRRTKESNFQRLLHDHHEKLMSSKNLGRIMNLMGNYISM